MPKHPPIQGDQHDGSWFLEAVGLKPPAPRPSETLAALERENDLGPMPSTTESSDTDSPAEISSTPHDGATSDLISFHGDPGTSSSSFDAIPTAPAPPQGLFDDFERDTPVVGTPLTDAAFAPVDETDLSPVLRTRRRFRWPAMILVVVVIAVAALTVFWLPRAQQQQAISLRQQNYDASLSVRSFIPSAQTALDAITNPASEDASVDASVQTISAFSSRGTELAKAAAEPLPPTFPVLTPAAIEDLAPLTQRSALLAADTSELARRLGHGYVYRTSIPELATPGDIPTQASASQIDAIAVQLAASLADDAGIVADLPDDPAFAPTLALASSTLEQYRRWQEVYLVALRNGDEASAADSISDLVALRSDLSRSNLEDLVTLRSELDGRLVSLASALDGHLDDLSR